MKHRRFVSLGDACRWTASGHAVLERRPPSLLIPAGPWRMKVGLRDGCELLARSS